MNMFRSVILALGVVGGSLGGVSYGGYGGGQFEYGYDQTHCHTKYNVKIEQSCHQEYDTIVDTTYHEQCQDIVTQHCNSVSQQVHQSSAVVGHDSQVVSHGYGKREAEPGYGYQQYPNLQCFSKPHQQCHQRPVQNQRQVCHEEYDTIVDTTYIEQCQDIVTQHCNSVSQQVHQSSAEVGHDSQVIKGGHYGKREAEPGYGGYSSGPQCQQKVDRQCHKVPKQNSRQVARPVCKTVVDTTYIEECEKTFTTECQQSHTQVHHSSAVVGHDSQVIKGGHYGKREAEPGYGGYSSGPQCQQKVDRQCQQVPQQVSRQVPRQVCVPVEVKIPYQVCGGSSVRRAQGSAGYHH